jgi:hypothetical protein
LCRCRRLALTTDTGEEHVGRLVGGVLVNEHALECPPQEGLASPLTPNEFKAHDSLKILNQGELTIDLFNNP